MKRIGMALAAALVLAGCAPSFKFGEVVSRPEPPKSIAVSGDIAQFLQELGKAYGSKDGADVENFLSGDFVYQGMDRRAYLRHLAENKAYFDRMEIRPLTVTQRGAALEIVAYGMMQNGPVPPSLQILPLNAGAQLVKEAGQWRLRGNQQWNEQGLYRQVTGIAGTFAPADMAAYRKLIPAGWVAAAEPLVQLHIVEWQSMLPPQTPYRLAQLNILVSRDGRNAWYYVEMPESDWLAVEAGRAVGFPKYVAEVAISAQRDKGWQTRVLRGGKELFSAEFLLDTDALEHLREQPRDGVIVVPGGPSLVTYNQPLGERGRLRTQPGWLTVSQAAPGNWQALLPVGKRVPAAVYHYDKPLKLVIPPLAQR